MATAQEQARYRALDSKMLVQIRLDPATVERLDRMVGNRGASGRAAVIESLITGKPVGDDPIHLAADGLRLVKAYFQATGEVAVHAGDVTAARR